MPGICISMTKAKEKEKWYRWPRIQHRRWYQVKRYCTFPSEGRAVQNQLAITQSRASRAELPPLIYLHSHKVHYLLAFSWSQTVISHRRPKKLEHISACHASSCAHLGHYPSTTTTSLSRLVRRTPISTCNGVAPSYRLRLRHMIRNARCVSCAMNIYTFPELKEHSGVTPSKLHDKLQATSGFHLENLNQRQRPVSTTPMCPQNDASYK